MDEAGVSSGFRVNQVVWGRAEETGTWYPGVIIDDDFTADGDSAETPPKDALSERIFWLGYSTTGLVAKTNVKDFCVGFKECYRNAASDAKTVESVKVAVQLAAVRAQEVLEDPTNEWLHWGLTNLGKFEELILSDTFYKSLGKKPPAKVSNGAEDSENNGEPGTSKKGFPRVGQLVWLKEEGSEWPAICVLRKPNAKLEVVVVFGPTLRRKTVAEDEVSNFCTEFVDKFKSGASSGDSESERLASVKRVVAVVSNQSEAEMGEGEAWETWAQANLGRYEDFCLSSDDVRDILANTSRTAGKGKAKGAKRAPMSATVGVKAGDPLTELYIPGVDEVAMVPAKKKRISFGKRQRVEFSEDEKVKLAVPLTKGWKRILAKRREPSKKFGDVYYKPPFGKKLRSMKEILETLSSNPGECGELGVENFCFSDIILGHANESVTEPPPKLPDIP